VFVESDAERVQRLVRPGWSAVGTPARFAGAVTGGLLAGLVLAVVARRVSVRTGVSDGEAFGSLPGDEVIPHPMVEWTRGVTVRTTPERVWPWLVQMGYGRGGWYTPEWVDLFANRWVFGAKSRYFDFSWTLVLGAVSSQRTRLLVRTRAVYSPQALRLLAVPLGLFDATYGVAMLRAIARRAESRAA
jgi:hypothetical protein